MALKANLADLNANHSCQLLPNVNSTLIFRWALVEWRVGIKLRESLCSQKNQ